MRLIDAKYSIIMCDKEVRYALYNRYFGSAAVDISRDDVEKRREEVW